MAALIQNPSLGMAQQAALAPWLRQASGPLVPIQHTNPPAAPWYQGQMDQRQAAQAEMVRQWQVKQDQLAAEAERQRLLEANRPKGQSSWMSFVNQAKHDLPHAIQAPFDPGGAAIGYAADKLGLK